jgi:hypothetical protein
MLLARIIAAGAILIKSRSGGERIHDPGAALLKKHEKRPYL